MLHSLQLAVHHGCNEGYGDNSAPNWLSGQDVIPNNQASHAPLPFLTLDAV